MSRARNLSRIVNGLPVIVNDFLEATDPDWTPAFNRAAATGRDILAPVLSGGYPVSGAVTMATYGQQIIGQGATKSYFSIDSGFDMGASGVVIIPSTASEQYAGLTDFGFEFAQPSTNVRADMVQYPPAIDGRGVSRLKFGGCVRITGAWDGLDLRGNTGGLRIEGSLDIGAVNKGLRMDGALDFITGKVNVWPFGFADATRIQVWNDGQTIAQEIGRVDGYGLEFTSFQARHVFFKTGGLGAFGSISKLKLDGRYSRVEGECTRLNIGVLYSTSDLADDWTMKTTGGLWEVGSVTGFSHDSGSAPIFDNQGAHVTFGSTQWENGSPDGQLFKSTGGHLGVSNVEILYGANSTRTQPFVEVTGGSLTHIGVLYPPKGTGSGVALAVSSTAKHMIDVGSANDWTVNVLLPQVTAANPLPRPPGARIVRVNGNTNFDAIAGGHSGDEMILEFTGTPTVSSGANLTLAFPFVATSGKTLHLICTDVWREVART